MSVFGPSTLLRTCFAQSHPRARVSRLLDSRFRGNDGRRVTPAPAGMTPAFAEMTVSESHPRTRVSRLLDSRFRGNDACFRENDGRRVTLAPAGVQAAGFPPWAGMTRSDSSSAGRICSPPSQGEVVRCCASARCAASASRCHFITLSPCHPVTVSPCHTSLPVAPTSG